MVKAEKKNNKIPFDPGLGQFALVFSTSYLYMDAQVRKFKSASQRKMKYKAYEPSIMKLCDNLISFYFCGMLYGAYIKNKYENSPKEIEGNAFLGVDIQECINGDVTLEVKTLEKFIKNNDKSMFATQKINPKYHFIIDNYVEFLEINNYFTDVKTTADLKVPSGLAYINDFSAKELDELWQHIEACINSKKNEKIFESKYFTAI